MQGLRRMVKFWKRKGYLTKLPKKTLQASRDGITLFQTEDWEKKLNLLTAANVLKD